MPIGHFYVFGEMSIKVFCHFFKLFFVVVVVVVVVDFIKFSLFFPLSSYYKMKRHGITRSESICSWLW